MERSNGERVIVDYHDNGRLFFRIDADQVETVKQACRAADEPVLRCSNDAVECEGPDSEVVVDYGTGDSADMKRLQQIRDRIS
jgi:hypothetical protein